MAALQSIAIGNGANAPIIKGSTKKAEHAHAPTSQKGRPVKTMMAHATVTTLPSSSVSHTA
jgi:hypothetical protein